METYKLFTKDPVKQIEEIILHEAIPFAFDEIIEDIEKRNKTIRRSEIIENIGLLVHKGLTILRNRGQEKKQIYELYHGCILAHFLNTVYSEFAHNLFYPEDESYDFLITKQPRDKKPELQLTNKEIHKKLAVFKIEFTEVFSSDSFKSVILRKLDGTHDYKGRILLVGVSFPKGHVNFEKLSNDILNVKQDSFRSIWVLGQTDDPNDPKKLCYFVAELIKHKRIFPLFELPIDRSRIKTEINKVLTQ